MLGVMRKNADSWVVKLILGIIALVFVLSFGASSYFTPGETAVKVNGESITSQQIDEEASQLMEHYQRQYGPEATRQIPRQQIMDQARGILINRMLINQALNELGIMTTEEEVKLFIESMPEFQHNGVFNFDLYTSILANRTSPEVFEAGLKQDINQLKLHTMINSAVFVTEAELEQFITLHYSKVKGAYLLYQTRDYINKISLTQEEKEAYYRARINEYMEPAKISFSYLNFTDRQFQNTITPTEEELLSAYEINIQRFVQPEALTVRSINLTLPPRATEAMWQDTREKAMRILQEAQAEGSDFVALARQYDVSPASRQGAEWNISAENLDDMEVRNRLFATKPGEITLMDIPNGLIIIKVEKYHPAQVKSLDEVRNLLTAELKASLSRQAAEKAANQVLLGLRQGKTLEEAAAPYGLKVEKSPLLAQDDTLPDTMPPMAAIWDSLQGLKPGQAGLPITHETGVVLPILDERVEASQKTFEQVAEEVTRSLSSQKALQAALAEAAETIGKLRRAAPGPVAAMLAQKGVKQTDPLLPDSELLDLPGSAGVVEALFGMSPANPVAEQPITVLDGATVVVLTEIIPPNKEELEQLKETQRQTLLRLKQSDAFNLFMRDQYAKAKIEVLR